MNRFMILLVLVLAVADTMSAQAPVTAQVVFTGDDSTYLKKFQGMDYGTIKPKVWLDVCQLNRAQYPDSNIIQPGNVITLPLRMQYIAEPGGRDHMWRASQFFIDLVVVPYLMRDSSSKLDSFFKTPSSSVQGVSNEEPYKFPVAILLSLILVAIVVLGILVTWRDSLRKRYKPFAWAVPSFKGASDEQVRSVAERALTRVFGHGFEIVGPIVRGVINGEQTIFFGGGYHEKEVFKEEYGYRAQLKFRDASEALVVSRWTCFNPVWSATGAQFRGTFTPEGGRPEEIPTITQAQANHFSEAIREVASGKEPSIPSFSFIPDRQPAPAPPESKPKAEVPVEKEKKDGKLNLTKVQFSLDKGLNLEGEIPLTMRELQELIAQIKGENAPKKDS